MVRRFWIGILLAGFSIVVSALPTNAQEYFAKLSGFQEVGGLGAGETGAILSTGSANVKLVLDRNAQTLTYTLTYTGLVDVLQSHIHFGKEHVAGGIMVFFCSNLGNGPAGTPLCPDDTGTTVTVTGTITAAGVVGPTAQGVTVGEFASVVAALESDTAYANIHTKAFPSGEIRGQVHAERHHDNDRGRGNYPGQGEDHTR